MESSKKKLRKHPLLPKFFRLFGLSKILNLHNTEYVNNEKETCKMNNKIIIGVGIGLVIGLVLGIFVSVIINLPSLINTGTGINNQVQVSGRVAGFQIGIINFVNLNETIVTSAPIMDGKYSVLLVGGQSYVAVIKGTSNQYALYVPSGVATFTHDF